MKGLRTERAQKYPMHYKLYRTIQDIAPQAWDACAGVDNPFISHAFFRILEDSGSVGGETGWFPQYVAFYTEAGVIAAVVPLFIKTHSYGEYVFDHDWAEAFEKAGGAYYPKLQIAVPFSPVPGARILIRAGCEIDIKEIADCLTSICRQLKISSVHMTFCTKEEQTELSAANWMPRLGIQFHWHNQNYKTFDDFLAQLSSNHRKTIKRERRDVQKSGLDIKTLSGAEITNEHWDAFYAFYLSTVERKWGTAYLTRSFFTLLSHSFPDKVVLVMAEEKGRPVAGALNLRGRETLYGRNWGSIGAWPFLHFELCYYRAIDYAIETGLKNVEAGAQGIHKIQRGYLPEYTYSAHWIAHSGLSRAVEGFLDHERQAIRANMQGLATLSPFKARQD